VAQTQLRRFQKRLFALLSNTFFWVITLVVNSLALSGAFIFHHLESGQNPNIKSFLDSFGWSVGLITTIGFGDVVPVTNEGKILSILMMAGGTIFLWVYMAFFVSALISPELTRLEHEISDVESELRNFRTDKPRDG
jgi:voltage-gated potassium channel